MSYQPLEDLRQLLKNAASMIEELPEKAAQDLAHAELIKVRNMGKLFLEQRDRERAARRTAEDLLEQATKQGYEDNMLLSRQKEAIRRKDAILDRNRLLIEDLRKSLRRRKKK